MCLIVVKILQCKHLMDIKLTLFCFIEMALLYIYFGFWGQIGPDQKNH